jgi:hypothetical protein
MLVIRHISDGRTSSTSNRRKNRFASVASCRRSMMDTGAAPSVIHRVVIAVGALPARPRVGWNSIAIVSPINFAGSGPDVAVTKELLDYHICPISGRRHHPTETYRMLAPSTIRWNSFMRINTKAASCCGLRALASPPEPV